MAGTKIAETKNLPPGSGTIVEAGGRTLALFNVDGCPWHGWRYDVTTGVHEENASLGVPCYPVTVEGGAAYVDL